MAVLNVEYKGAKKIDRGGTSWSSGWSEAFQTIEAGTSEANGGKVCMKVEANTDVWATVSKLTMSIADNVTYGPLTVKCRLYDFDPTPYVGIPSGQLWTTTVTCNNGNGTVEIDSGTINVSTGVLYLLFTITTTSSAYSPPEISFRDVTSLTITGTEQPIDLAVGKEAAVTGQYQTITARNQADRTLTFQVKYGSTVLTSGTVEPNAYGNPSSFGFTCDKAWFDTLGITTQKTITLTVSVVGHTGTTSFTLRAGADMMPEVTEVTVSCVQPSPASAHYPNTFLAGISKIKVAAGVVKKSNAGIYTVIGTLSSGESITLAYNSTTQKYEGTSQQPIAGSGSVSVVATDTRLMDSSAKSTQYTAENYTPPVINVIQSGTIRCDSQGQVTNGGNCYRAQAAATYSSLANNRIVSFTVKEKNTASATSITSGAQSGIIQTNVASTARMTIVFSVTDYVGYSASKTYIFDGSRVWMMWETPASGNGLNIGVGKRPEKILDGISTIDLDVNEGADASALGYLLEGMNAGAFQMPLDGTDMGASFSRNFKNTDWTARIKKVNATVWFWKRSNQDSLWSNFPSEVANRDWIGLRMVFPKGGGYGLVMVLEAHPVPGRLWFMYKGSGGWTSWYKLTPTT